MEFIQSIIDPKILIPAVGTFGVIAIVFVETGLFFGFFLPGDSLLFTAGFFASQGYLPLWVLLIGTFIASVLGDNVGYFFGKKIGPKIFSKEESVFFKKSHIEKAREFYEKHGKKTIILARFIPIVRTFAPIVAGVANMDYKTFFTYNLIGGFVWTWGVLWLGYIFGQFIPDAEKYIYIVIAVIVLTSAAPALREVFKEGMRRWKAVDEEKK
jgi:membrane-associated protein